MAEVFQNYVFVRVSLLGRR